MGQHRCLLILLLKTLSLVQMCMLCSACASKGEAYASPQALDPKISVAEAPPRPLDNSLIVEQSMPLPSQGAAIPVSQPAVEIVKTAPTSQPPTLITTPYIEPTSYIKKSGFTIALEHFLQHRNDEAIAALKSYPTDDQDAALVMLPILARMEEGETWQSLNGPQKQATLESLRSLCKRLSKSAPLVMQHVTLVDKQLERNGEVKPDRYGEIKPRSNSNYYPEDWVHAYAELVNLQDYINAEGLYNVRLEVTLELHGVNDQICWQASCPFQKAGSISPRNDYHVAINFNMPKQITPGAYQLMIIIHDRDTNRTARQSLPLQILDSKNKASGKRRS